MDSFTQIVLGVAVAHIGFGSKVNRRKTVVVGSVLGTLPDLDVYVAKLFNDPLTEAELHRGFFHSLVFFVLLSGVVTLLIRHKLKPLKPLHLAVTFFVVLATHSLLDIFTTWGTRILWPYPEKFALKSVFVVDVAYTIPLMVGVFLGLKKQKRIFTWAGIFLSSLYLVWGLVIQNSMKQKAAAEFYEIKPAEKVLNITAKPTFSNSVLWNVIIQVPGGFYLTDRSLFDTHKMKFNYFAQNANLIENLKDENIDRLKKISDGQYVITKNPEGLVFNDLRFGLLKKDAKEVQFAFSYQLKQEKNKIMIKEVPREKKDGMKWLKYTGKRIFSDKAIQQEGSNYQ